MRLLSSHILRIVVASSGLALLGCPLGSPISVECRAKDGKVDLLWTAMDGAASYRVLRGVGGAQRTPVGDATGLAYVDPGVTNGNAYSYVVKALDGGGQELGSSDSCSATPADGAGRDQPPGPSVVTGVTCRSKDGKVDLAWKPAAGAISYRVTRSSGGADPITAGQSAAEAFADFQAPVGTALQYRVIPSGLDGEGPPSDVCSVTASSPQGPPAPTGVACRAKDAKVDLTWDAVAGAQSYRVFRTQSGQSRVQIAETAGRVHADLALSNGTKYGYDVVALDARGRSSASSAICDATPEQRGGSGTPPPVVSDLGCRGKNDKANLTWTPVQGASLYRVFRSDAGAAAALVGETTGAVFADFGLTLGKTYGWSLESVGPGGAASARSTVCNVTASGRITGAANQPPRFETQPLTSVREQYYYYYEAFAKDPESDSVTYAVANGPPGLAIDPTSGLVTWIPSASQIGPQAVELRATDSRGGSGTQAFVIQVVDEDEPPIITSVPGRYARAGKAYVYDVDAFDPEGKPITFAFGAPVPNGMSIDPATGVIRWTPTVADAGVPAIEVRALDPGHGYASQLFDLAVNAEPLDLVEPTGDRVIHPGESIRLRLVANHPRAGFRVSPTPENASLENGVFEFKPGPDQEGVFDFGFEAILGDQHDLNPVRITVQRQNAPPVLGAVGNQTVKEGETLRVAIAATDPDGDAIAFSAPSLALPNAYFDQLTHTLTFAPSFEQSGSYDVAVAATDGRASVSTSFTIQVEESAPPAESLDLVVDPNQSPTLAPSVRIKGNVNGKPGTPEAAKFSIINGVAPVSVRQGRRVSVDLTARDVEFVAGNVSADFGDGLTVESVEVLSPTTLRAIVAAAPDAALGLRTIRALAAGQEVVSAVAFSVEQGGAEVTGILVDSFTGAPLVNARVSVQGSSIVATTDAQGRFVLAGVPAGENEIVVTAGNYAVRRLDLALETNQSLDFSDKIEVDALARAFSPGGSLPRAATAASLIDRGLGSKDADGLDLEKAKAIVQDTLLSLGGDEVGVLDEAGTQLNPNLLGSGFLTLTPAGVERMADMLLRGEVYTLRELSDMLVGGLGWAFGDALNFDRLRQDLQNAAIRAWANPGDPQNTLPILLLNEGNTLDPKMPIVSADTRFNQFQSFLFLTGFIRTNFFTLNDAVDRKLAAEGLDATPALRELGIDPGLLASGAAAPSGLASLVKSAGFAARLALGSIAPDSAWAATSTYRPPSGTVKFKTTLGTRLSAAGSAIIPGLGAGLSNAVVGVAVAALVALLAILATALFSLGPISFGFVATLGGLFVSSFIAGFVAKVAIAFFADPNAAKNLQPTPVKIIQKQGVSQSVDKTTGQNKVRIVFQRADTDLVNEGLVNSGQTNDGFFHNQVVNLWSGSFDPKFIDYRYHLWKFPREKDSNFGPGSGAKLISTRTQPVPKKQLDPTKAAGPDNSPIKSYELLQFVIDDSFDNIALDKNYYRVVTVQFYRRVRVMEPDFNEDAGPDGIGPRLDQQVNEALATSYADVFGSKPTNTETVAAMGRGDTLEEGYTIFGKFLNQNRDDLYGVLKARKEIARKMQERLTAKIADVRARQQIRADLAIAGSDRGKMVDVEIGRLEGDIKGLKQQYALTAIEKQRLASHKVVADELGLYLSDPKNLSKSREQILAELTDPNTELGRRVSTSLESGGANGKTIFNTAIANATETKQLELLKAGQESSLSQVVKAQKELDEALKLANSFGSPTTLPTKRVEVLLAPGSGRTRFDTPPIVIDLPSTINPTGGAEQVALLKGELKAQQVALEESLGNLAKVLPGSKSLTNLTFERMRYAFMNLDKTVIDAARKNLYFKLCEHQEAIKFKEEHLQANARIKELDEIAKRSEQAAASNPTKVATNLERGTLDGVISSERAITEPFSIGNSAKKFGTFVDKFLGPAIDVGSEAWSARDDYLVLRSRTSDVITIVRDGDGNIVAPPTIQAAAPGLLPGARPTLLATQPRLQGSALPEGVEDDGRAWRGAGSYALAPAPPIDRTPVPIFDSGEAVLGSSLERLHASRRQAVLKRMGSSLRTVQFSDLSGFPLPFEADPNPDNYLGVLRPTEPDGPAGKGGFLVRDFPYSDIPAEFIDAGFPSELIAVDSKGAVYLENANSNPQYGGRIFRYAGDPVSREHVGAVTYYSLNLQYARPTQPRAMEIAEGVSSFGKIEDLFVAELDPGIYINQNIKPVNRILRVPIHQADRLAFYANGQNRNRLVGQPYAEHPDFQMTGPSDLERDKVPRVPDPDVPLPLYFSDEENLFVIQDNNKDGQGEVAKVVSLPGRRWSGLAIDSNGSLYFADFLKGEVFLLPSTELDVILIQNQPIKTEEELQNRAYVLRVGMREPGDIELDSWEHRYLVATLDGIVPFNIPIVGRLRPDTAEIRVDIIGREAAVTRRADRGNMFIAASGSEGAFGNAARFRVRHLDPVTGEAEWSAVTVSTRPYGASILPDPL